ncbi:hypothetical protein IWX49DRAFT_414070 [Phyllosticta citricarpa]
MLLLLVASHYFISTTLTCYICLSVFLAPSTQRCSILFFQHSSTLGARVPLSASCTQQTRPLFPVSTSLYLPFFVVVWWILFLFPSRLLSALMRKAVVDDTNDLVS